MPPSSKNRIAETDLYAPVAAFLAAQGYTVRGEVGHCDLAAVKDDAVVVVELKKTLNLTLVAQAVRRQAITPSVYVAIPRPANKGKWLRQVRHELSVLRRLEIGLLLVALTSGKPAVDVVLHPEPSSPRQRHPKRRAILKEVARRSGDFNTGGSCRRKLITAYRENAIQVASCLHARGPLSPRALRALGTGEKTLGILRRNVYGWFEWVERGIYRLSEKGCEELGQYPELAAQYRPLSEP
ncbi:MAG: DUF2161 family putative PD-(D/E)XK-type phosphodiesterase [Armatimonadota bacterium]